MKAIASRDNAAFKHLRALAEDGAFRRSERAAFLDGAHLVDAALVNGAKLRRIAVTQASGTRGDIAPLLARAAKADCELLELTEPLMKLLSPADGDAAIVAELDLDLHARSSSSDDVVLLAGVQDPGNLGTMLRTAAAAGIGAAILDSACAQAWSPKVLRAGMGAHFHIAIHERADLGQYLASYSGRIVGTALSKDSADLYNCDLLSPTAWIFGSEGGGVPDSLLAHADCLVRIPMPGETESLNVGAALAVCLFEQLRQRRRHKASI